MDLYRAEVSSAMYCTYVRTRALAVAELSWYEAVRISHPIAEPE